MHEGARSEQITGIFVRIRPRRYRHQLRVDHHHAGIKRHFERGFGRFLELDFLVIQQGAVNEAVHGDHAQVIKVFTIVSRARLIA